MPIDLPALVINGGAEPGAFRIAEPVRLRRPVGEIEQHHEAEQDGGHGLEEVHPSPGIVTASLGMLIFLPQIVKQLGLTNMQVGWVTMIPYGLGAISMVIWGRVSDRNGERRWNLTLACVVATAGLIIAGLTVGTVWSLAGMSIAAIGFYGSKGPFWSMPPMF